MQKLVESVPNFSNGRDPEVYNRIADAIRSVRGTKVLDVSADADHNRTVVTFVGSPEVVEEAAFQAIATAAPLIDLDEHEGEHPRIGAADVFPFIPIRGVSTEECVEMAHRVAKRVGEELGIATYLYGSAATTPKRKKLSYIRRGQYEAWKAEVGDNPERKPDYGPAEPKSWGATVIGVRPFLIAYNIYLNSSNVQIADQIARAVRHSSGGLRFIQAKGFLVEGQAQVSMNLTNFEKTPVYRVQEMVRREAARYGLTITKAELIGLTPQKAFMDAAKWYLQLDDFREDQVLEYRLYEERDDDFIPDAYLAATADSSPTPGGGSAAALAGALGAALTRMVAGLTAGRKKYADVSDQAEQILAEAGELQQQLRDAISEDAAAFEQVMAAWRNKDLEGEAKKQAVEEATIGAGEVPLRVANLSARVARLAQQIAQMGNVNAVSDAAAGAILARAAVEAAALNVKINGVGLQDQTLAQSWRDEIDQLEKEVNEIVTAVKETTASRGGF